MHLDWLAGRPQMTATGWTRRPLISWIPTMSSTTKTPNPPARGLGAIVSSCAALAISTVFAGGMLLMMR